MERAAPVFRAFGNRRVFTTGGPFVDDTLLISIPFNKANSFEKKREKKSIADSYRSCVICNHRVEDPSSWNVLLLHQQQQRTKTQTQKLN